MKRYRSEWPRVTSGEKEIHVSQKIKLRTAKVLVVDDEPEITDIVQTFLTESGYSVDVLNNPREVIARAKQFKPDVILLDIMMPGADGYTVCQWVKAEADLSHVPVIFLTGKDRNDDQGRSFKSGGDMFIKK